MGQERTLFDNGDLQDGHPEGGHQDSGHNAQKPDARNTKSQKEPAAKKKPSSGRASGGGRGLYGKPKTGRRQPAPKETSALQKLTDLEEKIKQTIQTLRSLKKDNAKLMQSVTRLEASLKAKDKEISGINIEKAEIKEQLEDILNELETIQLS